LWLQVKIIILLFGTKNYKQGLGKIWEGWNLPIKDLRKFGRVKEKNFREIVQFNPSVKYR